MGAYLSRPKTDKVSNDESNELLVVGASSMQGWRNSQEDAHNAILNFDTDSSFFAVYDGHGGAEVATYCADNLPTFLKALATYQSGEFEQALKNAFLGFDKTLLEPQVVEILKILAGEKKVADAVDGDEDDEDLVELHEESNLPLNEVLEKYKGGLSMPILKRVKDGSSTPKPLSPFLRGRRAAAVAADAANKAVMDPDAKPQGSSTSAAALAALAAAGSSNDAGPSSSKSAATKMENDGPEEDSTVSSSSSSASKSNNSAAGVACIEAEAIAPSASRNIKTNGAAAAAVATSVTATSSAESANSSNSLPDSSHVKESEQNGSVTSSEAKPIKADVSTSSPASTKADPPKKSIRGDATVSASSDAAGQSKQNGSLGNCSSSSSSSALAKVPVKADGAAISSTSKGVKKGAAGGEDDSTDDDADYDAENSSNDDNDARHSLEYSSEDDLDDDDDEEGDEDMDDEDDDDDDDDDEDEDEESALANDQFCANMIEEPGKDSGCTAVVALMCGRDLYVANAGDSRCVISRNGKAIEMSLDHKPEDSEESDRIIKAGGRVTLDGRVNGGLNLSRAIGDHAYKMKSELPAEEQMISALPDIKKLIISPEDEFMVLACDGIWNFMSSEEVVDFVRLRLKDSNKKMSEICEELFDNCLAPNTMGDGTGCDNMTAVIVRFKPKMMELNTKINPNETEDVLFAKRAADADAADVSLLKSLKRCASPTTKDDNSNEAENANKMKRLKTDEEETLTTTTTTSSTTAASKSSNSPTANNNNNNNSNAASSSTSSTVRAAEQKECDSVSAADEAVSLTT